MSKIIKLYPNKGGDSEHPMAQEDIDYSTLTPRGLIPRYSQNNDYVVGVLNLAVEGFAAPAMDAWSERYRSVIDQAALIMKQYEIDHGKDSWKSGMKRTDIIKKLYRHAYRLSNQEDVDPDTGFRHIGHIYCELMFLDYYDKKEFTSIKGFIGESDYPTTE